MDAKIDGINPALNDDYQRGAEVSSDHRKRVGIEKRARMRRHLLVSAISFFSRTMSEPPVIDDFVREAGVSRGTFYNYYPNAGALLEDLLQLVSDEIFVPFDEAVAELAPIERIATASRLIMSLTYVSLVFARLMASTAPRNGVFGHVARLFMMRDLEVARETGAVRFVSMEAAVDLLIGCASYCLDSIVHGRMTREASDEAIKLSLYGLRVSEEMAEKAFAIALPTIDPVPGSLLDLMLGSRRL